MFVSLIWLFLCNACSQDVTPVVKKNESSPIAGRSKEKKLLPRKLYKEKMIIDGNLPLFPALIDVNSDLKLDLLVGSKSHDFWKDQTPQLQREYRTKTRSVYAERKQLSFHLNRSSGDQISFAEPYWLSDLIKTAILPSG